MSFLLTRDENRSAVANIHPALTLGSLLYVVHWIVVTENPIRAEIA